MNPIQAAVNRPYTVAVAVILTALFSAFAAKRIPLQLKPTVDTPRISIATSFRGASAAEVEEQVTRELEEVLQNVQGLVEMTSTSGQGSSSITLEFEYGFDTQSGIVDVINKLNAAVVKALQDKAFVQRLQAAGAEPSGNTPAQHAAEIKKEFDKMKNLVKVQNIKLEQ